MTYHEKCLKRARKRRERGLLSHKQEKEKRVEEAWRNIFKRAGILK
jgi:hypothetical protein